MNKHLTMTYNNFVLNLHIGFDTYECKNVFIDKNILEIIINSFNSNNYFVKTSHIWLKDTNILIKYSLSNYNNNITFTIYEDCYHVGSITFESLIKKTQSSVKIDKLSDFFTKLSF